MANTGKKNVNTLKQVAPPIPPGTPTGLTKPNTMGDPDYIAPYIDLVACPVVATLDCPDLAATGGVAVIEYEFSITPSVSSNPSVDRIRILFTEVATSTTPVWDDYTLPLFPQTNYKYKSANMSGRPTGQWKISAKYFDASNVELKDCPDLATVILS